MRQFVEYFSHESFSPNYISVDFSSHAYYLLLYPELSVSHDWDTIYQNEQMTEPYKSLFYKTRLIISTISYLRWLFYHIHFFFLVGSLIGTQFTLLPSFWTGVKFIPYSCLALNRHSINNIFIWVKKKVNNLYSSIIQVPYFLLFLKKHELVTFSLYSSIIWVSFLLKEK